MSSAPTISYTERDFQSVRTALLNWIRVRFEKDWKEFGDTSVGKAMVDVVAWVHSQRAFYYDMQALNCYLETATLPESVMSIARQLGYKRRMATSASVPITLYPNPPQAVPITIRKGEKIALGDTLVFEAAADYVVPPGKAVWPDNTTTDIVTFVQGETRTEEFISDGSMLQSFQLTQNNVLQQSVAVTIQDELWQETDSLIFIEGTGRGRDSFIGTGEDDQVYTLSLLHVLINPQDEDCLVVLVGGVTWLMVTEFTGAPQEYRVSQDQDGKTILQFGLATDGSAPTGVIDAIYQITATQRRFVVDYTPTQVFLCFGDGLAGQIPPNGAVIYVAYRVSGGVVGNVRRGQIDMHIRGYLPSGAGTNVRAYNHESGSGGELEETIEHIKMMAPRYVKASGRAVTTGDWITLALSYRDPLYGAPAFATARLKQRLPEKNTVEVTLWSRDNYGRITTASSPLKQGVKSYLNAVRTTATYIEMLDGDVLYFDIVAEVYLLSGRTVSSILSEVSASLQNYFNSTYVAPGTDLVLSLINEKIQQHTHIESSTLTKVEGSRLQSLDLGVGDDVKVWFSGTFVVPAGVQIIPTSFILTNGTATITDDGAGNLIGDIDDTEVNVLDYATGYFSAYFAQAPALATFVTAEARILAYMNNVTTKEVEDTNILDSTVEFTPIIARPQRGIGDGVVLDGVLPVEFLPYTPRQVAFIGGWDFFGTQPGGQLLALDDGTGLFTIDATGTIDYETGKYHLEWNTTPPPVSVTTYYGYLNVDPDGILQHFEFEVRTAPNGGGLLVNLQTLFGRGRLKLRLSDLSTLSVVFEDAWDNGRGQINGDSLALWLSNLIVYEDPSLLISKGVLNFVTAPEGTAGRNFSIEIAPVTQFLYTTFAAYLSSGSGYQKLVLSDEEGRLLGDVAQAYPLNRLDLKTGHYLVDLAGANVSGRIMSITYDAAVRARCRNIPIGHDTMPTFSTVSLQEMYRPVNV